MQNINNILVRKIYSKIVYSKSQYQSKLILKFYLFEDLGHSFRIKILSPYDPRNKKANKFQGYFYCSFILKLFCEERPNLYSFE